MIGPTLAVGSRYDTLLFGSQTCRLLRCFVLTENFFHSLNVRLKMLSLLPDHSKIFPKLLPQVRQGSSNERGFREPRLNNAFIFSMIADQPPEAIFHHGVPTWRRGLYMYRKGVYTYYDPNIMISMYQQFQNKARANAPVVALFLSLSSRRCLILGLQSVLVRHQQRPFGSDSCSKSSPQLLTVLCAQEVCRELAAFPLTSPLSTWLYRGG